MFKFNFLRNLTLIVSFVFCSIPVLLSLCVLWFIFLLSLIEPFRSIIYFVCSFVFFISFLHGWYGLSHVLEDYVFNLLLRHFFVSLVNVILFRVFITYFF